MSPDDPLPNDPFSTMADAATGIHELFVAFQAAGFDAGQALYLVATMLTANMRPMPPQP